MTVSPATIAAGDFFEKGSIPKFALRPDGRGAWFGRKNGTGGLKMAFTGTQPGRSKIASP